jgi:hypothetical protein
VSPGAPLLLPRLVHRARNRLWLAGLLDHLTRALWLSGLVVLLGGLARWLWGHPGPAVLALLSVAPVLAALIAAAIRRPRLDQAAAAADRWLHAEGLLMSAWHLSAGERTGAAAPVVLAQAARAAPSWLADMARARPTLRPGGLWPPVLTLLAVLPVLALVDTPEPPPAVPPGPSSAAPPAAPQGRPAPLSELVAELKSKHGPSPRPATSADPAPAGPGPSRASPPPRDRRASAETPPGAERRPVASTEGRTPEPPPPGDSAAGRMRAATSGASVRSGRDGAGSEAAPASHPVHLEGAPDLPVRLSPIERRGPPRASAQGPGGAPVAQPAGARTAAPAEAPPAESPPGRVRELDDYGPAARTLVARFFRFSRQRNDHE